MRRDAYLPYSSQNHWRHGAHATAPFRICARWSVNNTPTFFAFTAGRSPTLRSPSVARAYNAQISRNSAASYMPPNTTLPNHGQIVPQWLYSSPATNLCCASCLSSTSSRRLASRLVDGVFNLSPARNGKSDQNHRRGTVPRPVTRTASSAFQSVLPDPAAKTKNFSAR